MLTDCVVIYRKDVAGPKYNTENYDKAPNKAQKAEAADHLEYIARVRRPELEAFLTDGFYSLTPIAPKTIDNKGERMMRHRNDGWIVPVGSLGRKGTADRSAAQSVLLWIKQNMGHVVNPDQVSIVVQRMDVAD